MCSDYVDIERSRIEGLDLYIAWKNTPPLTALLSDMYFWPGQRCLATVISFLGLSVISVLTRWSWSKRSLGHSDGSRAWMSSVRRLAPCLRDIDEDSLILCSQQRQETVDTLLIKGREWMEVRTALGNIEENVESQNRITDLTWSFQLDQKCLHLLANLFFTSHSHHTQAIKYGNFHFLQLSSREGQNPYFLHICQEWDVVSQLMFKTSI